MSTLQAIILAIIEGLTEFLPISSTGHMIIASSLMHVESNDFVKVYTVAIQLGAILSVIILYWRRFLQGIPFYIKLAIATIPALALGYLLGDVIDSLLESPQGVAIALLLGGVVLLFIDKIFPHAGDNAKATNDTIPPALTKPTIKEGFIIGVWQCLALIPGVSRSAASIIGGMTQKLTRRQAAEFSFFLAVPTMFAATAYKLLKHYKEFGFFTADETKTLIIGNVVAFIVAMLAIRFFINYLSRKGFFVFGIYRIILGGFLLIMYALDIQMQII